MPVSRAEAVALNAMLNSKGWTVFRREALADLELKRSALESVAMSQDRTSYLRGEIAAVRVALAIPAALIRTAPPDEDGDAPARKAIKDYKRE